MSVAENIELLSGIIDNIVDCEMKSLISDLQTLIRHPSVSAKKQGLVNCAKSIADIMDKAGIKSELLYFDDVGLEDHSEHYIVPPLVYGEVKSKSNPQGKTILFYNHYDVQPEDPIELWNEDPFSGKVEGDCIFGRGSADDKGALITLRDDKGKILVRDWYKEVRQFTPEELSILSRDSFDEQEFKKEYQISTFVNNVSGIDAIKSLVGMATCNIAGLTAGYIGEGAKTVLPAIASAKLDFRLVPNMTPEKQFSRLQDHLKENGFGNDVEARLIHGEAAVRTPTTEPFVRQVEESANEIFGSSIISISSAGTGPMYPFVKILNVPCISIGSTYIFSRIHSPNEFARIDLLNKTTKCIGHIMEKFAN